MARTDLSDAAWRQGRGVVHLVTLSTYANRDAKAVSRVFRFSTVPAAYKYGGGSLVQFEACVLLIDQLRQEADLLATQRLSGASPLSQAFLLRLANVEHAPDGLPLARVFATEALEFASVEFASLHLDSMSRPEDLSALAGTEHTVWYRGRLVRRAIRGGGAYIDLEFETELPTYKWERVLDTAAAADEDVGRLLPVVYGAKSKVPLVRMVAGAVTTLAEPVTKTQTGLVRLTSTKRLSDSGTVWVSGEEWTYSAKDDSGNSITVSARGASGTTKIEHQAGEPVVELIAEIALGASALPVEAISRLYLLNPFGGDLFEVLSPWTPKLLDAELLPGRAIASVRISAENLRAILSDAHNVARVTVQPDFESSAGSTKVTKNLSSWSGSAVNDPSGLAEDATNPISFTSTGCVIDFQGVGGSPPNPKKYARFLNTAGTPSGVTDGMKVTRWKITCTITPNGFGAASEKWGMGIHAESSFPGKSNGQVLHYITRTGSASGNVVNFDGGFQTAPSNSTVGDWRNADISFRMNEADTDFSTNGDNLALTSVTLVIEVETASGDVTQTQDAEITAQQQGWGLEWFADVRGAKVPHSMAAGYGFEEAAAGYNSLRCDKADDTTTKQEGTQALKLSRPAVSVVQGCEATTGWTGSNATLSAVAGPSPGGLPSQGSNYLQVDVTGNPTSFYAEHTFGSNQDWTGQVLLLDVELDQDLYDELLAASDPATGLSLWFGRNATNEKTEWRFGVRQIPAANTKVTLAVEVGAVPPSGRGSKGSSFTTDDVNWLRLEMARLTSDMSGGQLRVDNVRIQPKRGRVQRTSTTGTVDLTAASLLYQLGLRASVAGLISSVRVWLSDTAGTGTTEPANRRELRFLGSAIGAGAWMNLQAGALDVGTPTVVNVETVGVEVEWATAEGACDLWVDDLQRGNGSAPSGYVGAAGSLIEGPADLWRHFLTEGCREPATSLDSTTWAEVAARLATNLHALELRELGYSFEELQQALCFETRCRLVPVERSSGRLWKLHTAKADYSFAASTLELSGSLWDEEGLFAPGERFTEFLAHYLRDPSKELGEQAFSKLVRADAEQNDTPVSSADLAAARARYGLRQAEAFAFLGTEDERTAQDLLGWIVYNSTRSDRRRLTRVFPWWEAVDLELYDVRLGTPPDSASSVPLLILARVFDPMSGLITVVAEQVRTT